MGFDPLFAKSRSIIYQRHEVILRPEDIPGGVYYLKKGFIELYALSEAGEKLTLIIFKPGDVFPLAWAVGDIPNRYYLSAMTGIELKRCSKNDFLAFIKNEPAVLYELLNHVSVRLHGLLERTEYLVFGSSYDKVASILLICAMRFGKKENGNIIIQVPLTHKDVAELVGLTRETTSLKIKKLEKEGLIARRGKFIIVKNMKKLKKATSLEDVNIF
ncbi:Crp/Fnr family transcriptional regulator [Patescibacteria group bacterium]|nr:Crp/Fnr family transcriptional regulator [Patescibacteria group bacterium]MCL5009989.1 Crp/Fnr family transcriptional regulator [Patescibacteria group bacterium]